MKRFFILFIVIYCLTSCGGNKSSFLASDIHFLTNISNPDSIIRLPLDMNNAVLNGIEIPTKNQTKTGYFNFSFKIKNTSENLQRFFYKIYYQNESYKFNEDHPLASENFYGSWENTNYIFKNTKTMAPGQEIEITDSFRIVGNPRNEKNFFGADPYKNPINDTTILATINYMKTLPDWVKQITEKSKQYKVTVEEQFYMDALWSLNDKRQKDSTTNNRWKRNPRIGLYKFMMVVASHEDLEELPTEIKDLSKKNKAGDFVNPFVYFGNPKKSRFKNYRIFAGDKKLICSAKIDLSKGIYINPLSVNNVNYSRSFYTTTCNDSLDKYSKAQIELFFHNIDRDYVLHNVPETRDVTGENFTRKEYADLKKQYEKSGKLIDTYVNSTDCPCKNVSLNKEDNSITIKNPGNAEGEFKKEHVGLVTRIGFTYGKFRAKIKFAGLLSKDNVWNGITNAFWMMAQDVNANWNMRTPCNADIGYISKNEGDNKESEKHSKRQITYSEIDFEILKESEFWPATSYKNSNVPYQTDDCANNQDVMVTCTNWDMSCRQTKFYNIGAVEHAIDGTKYIHHRWNTFYKALTTKVRANNDELFNSPYYYFEIEWAPQQITWRIGPEKDKMRTICVMDKNVSSIPSNQMLMIITQEWHNQEWWPTAPYKQNFIPFPKNDIVGKVLELEIE